MLPKQRQSYGRSRMTPRSGRRSPIRGEGEATAMALARRTACHFVAARWPDLAAVTPVATVQLPRPPSPALLARLGLRADQLQAAPRCAEYTFTFVGELQCPDGARTPMVASVTVDAHQRIVKTSVSK